MLIVDGESCVHGVAATARCRRCADACPTQAWQTRPNGLDLDPDKCDECGLCLPACPTGAVRLEPHRPLPPVEQGVWRLSCEKVAGSNGLTCVHALSEAQLLAAYEQGARRLLLQVGNCDTCFRGMARRLTSRVDAVNNALRRRGVDLLAVDWDEMRSVPPQAAQGRQSFFRRLLKKPLNLLAGELPSAAAPLSRRATLERLRRIGPGPGLWAIRIAADACDGCGVCVRLCPEQALSWLKAPDWSALRLDMSRCIACELCVDVCDRNAMQPAEAEGGGIANLVFQTAICGRCGSDFRLPTNGERRPLPKGAPHFCAACKDRVSKLADGLVVD